MGIHAGRLGTIAALWLCGVSAASANAIVDFSALTGASLARDNLSTSSTTFGTPAIGIDAFWWNGSAWTNTNNAAGAAVTLFARDETNDRGLGVCSPGEQANTYCRDSASGGGGDVNELDNAGTGELIRLTRPDGWTWAQLWVSSLDSGDSDGTEEGRLYWSNSAGPIPSGAFYHDFQHPGGSAVEFSLAPAGFESAKYLFFAHQALTGEGNDYLVYKAVLTEDEGGGPPSEIPEPASLLLVAAGLLGLGLRPRRQRS